MEDRYFLIKDGKIENSIYGYFEIEGFETILATGWENVKSSDIYDNGIFYDSETMLPVEFIEPVIEYIPTEADILRADIDYLAIMMGVEL